MTRTQNAGTLALSAVLTTTTVIVTAAAAAEPKQAWVLEKQLLAFGGSNIPWFNCGSTTASNSADRLGEDADRCVLVAGSAGVFSDENAPAMAFRASDGKLQWKSAKIPGFR
jgi:hypothetical protein